MESDDEVEDLGIEEEEDRRSDCCSLLSLLLLFPFLPLSRIPLSLCHSGIGAFLHVPALRLITREYEYADHEDK